MGKSKFVNAAIAEAEKSTGKEKHGAVLVMGGKIMTRGHNSLNPYPFYYESPYEYHNCYTHAEMDVLCKFLTTCYKRKGLRKGVQA